MVTIWTPFLKMNFSDNAHGRVLTVEADNANLTMESCVASCDAQNFTIAGGEFSVRVIFVLLAFTISLTRFNAVRILYCNFCMR